MRVILLFMFAMFTFANTSELFMAVSERCQLGSNWTNVIIFNFASFTKKLELSFNKTRMSSPEHAELLRELEPSYIWLLLKSKDPTLLEELVEVRNAILDMYFNSPLSDACMDWLDILLGDEEKTFHGSYLELLIRSLSATGNKNLAKLSTRQMLFVNSELRRMHFEREHLFLPKDEELHEIYTDSLLVYISLINPTVGKAIQKNARFVAFPLTFIPRDLTRRLAINPSVHHQFLCNYVDFRYDFILYDGCLHLKKTTNFWAVYRTWLAMTAVIPNEAMRKLYFDEQADLYENLKGIENMITGIYLLKDNPKALLEWDRKAIINITIAFDLINSLVSFMRLHHSMAQVKRMLAQVMENYQRLMNFLACR